MEVTDLKSTDNVSNKGVINTKLSPLNMAKKPESHDSGADSEEDDEDDDDDDDDSDDDLPVKPSVKTKNRFDALLEVE